MTYMLRSALSIKRAVYDAWKTKSKERELNLNACTCRRTHLGDGLGLLLSNTLAVGGGAQFGMAEARLKHRAAHSLGEGCCTAVIPLVMIIIRLPPFLFALICLLACASMILPPLSTQLPAFITNNLIFGRNDQISSLSPLLEFFETSRCVVRDLLAKPYEERHD